MRCTAAWAGSPKESFIAGIEAVGEHRCRRIQISDFGEVLGFEKFF
jgi:hypothetical protein